MASGKPVSLSSGHYTVGKDFKSGRYKATNVGRGSNFVVYDKDGDVVVNTILGNGGIGSGDYVFSCDDGYTVETEAPVKLIPVK
ncbi:hypothetical protein CN514_12345 [Bacillus sp. AFS001701]|nr:hypothetical protein CN514_12345 [Bacillus sp. AFS001701]